MNLDIPLSGYYESSPGYYANIDLGLVTKDIDLSYRVVGYRSGNGISDPSMQYMLGLEIPVPVRQNALNSAFLSFSLLQEIPPIPDTENQVLVDDWRQAELFKFRTYNDFSLGVTTLKNFSSLANYSVLTTSPKYGNLVFSNTDTNTIVYLNVTDLLKFHTSKNSWNSNDLISLIVSGVPSGSGGGGAIEIESLYLQLDYGAVPPNAPTNLTASESAYRQATLNWSLPSDDGGDSITKYVIHSGAPSGVFDIVSQWHYLAESSTTTTTIDNLPTDTKIKFRVAAVNSSGVGEFSVGSNVITLSKNLTPVTSLSFNDSNTTRIRIRRASSGEWSSFNPVLAIGEIAFETDSYRLKVGDGLSFWTGLPYITLDQSVINFPDPPDTFLRVASSETNQIGNDRIVLNLSQNNRLNLIGKEGVVIDYDDNFKKVVFSADKLYNPIAYGTIYNPTSSGTPGSLLHDNNWMYFCVDNNYWKRSPIDRNWVDFSQMIVSHSGTNLYSLPSMIFSDNTVKIDTNTDPYPALAGRPLTNSAYRDFVQNFIVPQDISLLFTYRGGTNTHNPMAINADNAHGILMNGSIVKSASAGTGTLPGFVSAPSGFTYNIVYHMDKFNADLCGGYPDDYGIYNYRNGLFLKNCWSTELVYTSNIYYSGSSFNGDYFRHTNGHSKILGFCLDGYPIYGPFAHSGALDYTSDIILMRSSYSGLTTDDHRPTDWKYYNTIGVNDIEYQLLPGMFLEDFIYVEQYGTLDNFNGRFCVTPEFPSGTYAYFLTFTNDSLTIPAFPYIFGTGTKEQIT